MDPGVTDSQGSGAQSLLSTHTGSVRKIPCGKVAVLGSTVIAVKGAGQRRRKGIWGGAEVCVFEGTGVQWGGSTEWGDLAFPVEI